MTARNRRVSKVPCVCRGMVTSPHRRRDINQCHTEMPFLRLATVPIWTMFSLGKAERPQSSTHCWRNRAGAGETRIYLATPLLATCPEAMPPIQKCVCRIIQCTIIYSCRIGEELNAHRMEWDDTRPGKATHSCTA